MIQSLREATRLPTVSEVADLQVAVQTDHSHRDEASAAKEETRPAIETAAFPAKQPAVWQARHDEKWLSCHCGGTEKNGNREMGVGGETRQKNVQNDK